MSETDDKYDMIFKLVLVGDSGVGKTNLLLRYLKQEFSIESKSTVGVEFGTKNFTIDNNLIKVQIWDTAGQERYRSITRAYYKGAHGALVVYDISKKETFFSTEKWIKDLKSNGEEKLVITLIGNKSDLEINREISTNDGKARADEKGVAFLETSALNADNVEKAFDEMINTIYESYKNDLGEDDFDDGVKDLNAIDLNTANNEKEEEKKNSCC